MPQLKPEICYDQFQPGRLSILEPIITLFVSQLELVVYVVYWWKIDLSSRSIIFKSNFCTVSLN